MDTIDNFDRILFNSYGMLPLQFSEKQELSIVDTGDGSKTIYNPWVGELYHSRHGALQESKHVFLNAGLEYFLHLENKNSVSILEVGFGTGLNFLLSADYCEHHQIELNYTGLEVYPLKKEMITQTGYEAYLSETLWMEFKADYEQCLKAKTTLSSYCSLYIAPVPLLNYCSDTLFDIIYFDAFAAAFQPEMWTEEAISRTLSFLKPGGVFVTYAITGQLKRLIVSLGCRIEKIKGAAGKREMLRAIKLSA